MGKPALCGTMSTLSCRVMWLVSLEPSHLGQKHRVTRLSLIYALLDHSEVIRLSHLQSALAVWQYCEASARYIFGDATGDPMSDAVLAALKEAPDGLTMSDLHELLNKNYKADRIKVALRSLEQNGMARSEKRVAGSGAGRPAEVWYAISITEGYELNELIPPAPVVSSFNSYGNIADRAPISKYDTHSVGDEDEYEEGDV